MLAFQSGNYGQAGNDVSVSSVSWRLKAFIVFVFVYYGLLAPVQIAWTLDETASFARYSLALYLLPIIGAIATGAIRKDDKVISFPPLLIIGAGWAFIGWLIGDLNAETLLNIGSYVVPYLGISVLFRNIGTIEEMKEVLELIITSMYILALLMLMYSIAATFQGFPCAPEHFPWEANGFSKPLRFLTYYGHHTAAFMSGFCAIFSFYRLRNAFIQKKKWATCIYSFLLALFFLFGLLSSARVALILFLVFIPVAVVLLLAKKLPSYILPLIGLGTVSFLYVVPLSPEASNLVVQVAEALQDAVGTRVVNLQYYTLFSGREQLWVTLFSMVMDSPFIGHGHRLPFDDYGHRLIPQIRDFGVPGNVATTESGLLMAAKYGLPVFACFVAFLSRPFLYKGERQIEVLLGLVSCYMILLFMVNGTFLLTYDYTITMVFLLILANRLVSLAKKSAET